MKEKTILFRSIVFLLAVFLSVVCFTSCGKTGNTETASGTDTESDTTANTAETQDTNLDENGFVKSSLPAGLNLDKDVSILYWSDYYDSLYCGDDYQPGELVSDASHARDIYTEEYLNVFLKWVPTLGGGYANAANFLQAVTTQAASGGSTQLIAGYSRCMTTLAIQGLLYDVNTLEKSYIDLEKPWWTYEMASQLQLGNSSFLYAGDISGDLLTSMIAVFYNMDMIDTLRLDDPSELVQEKQWTYEKMLTMAANAYYDGNNNGLVDDSDRIGLGFVEWSTTAFYVGFGYKIIQNFDGYLSLSSDYSGNPAIDFVEKAMALLTDTGVAKTGGGTMMNSFSRGEMLFMTYELRTIMNDIIRNSNIHYGVLPTPMVNTEQERYYTYPGLNYTIWGILGAISPEEATEMTAVLECMGGKAYRELTPAIFEYGFKLRYSEDETVSNMYQLVRDSLAFDFGFLCARNVMNDQDLAYQMSNSAWGGISWSTTFAEVKSLITSGIKAINQKFE